jgi:amidase
MPERAITPADSGAFMELFELAPLADGPLDGLRFAVKDIMDVAGRKTGCGNPRWLETHPPAVAHAVCVEQLLQAGGRCIGKTITDQLAFSLLGENHFYGTPLNPKAPERVPGGSSSGSASAVACGLADLALGSDTGGSVRVPASNCGIWGMRPSHGVVSLAGVMPFAPSFDTVGPLARDADTLARAASVLLACELPERVEIGTLHLIREAFALADPEVQAALQAPVDRLRQRLGSRLKQTSIRSLDGESSATGLENWLDTYCVIQWAEVWSCLGGWIEEARPDFGPVVSASFELVRNLDRRRLGPAICRREAYCRRLADFLGPRDLLCLPTVPAPAPRKGDPPRRDAGPGGYYPRALSLTSVAGIGRLPQVSMPLADVNGLPVGLSLLAARGNDAFLLAAVRDLAGG